jgi:hypothetical protein
MFDALITCEDAYKQGDWPAFWRCAEEAKQISKQLAKASDAQ